MQRIYCKQKWHAARLISSSLLTCVHFLFGNLSPRSYHNFAGMAKSTAKLTFLAAFLLLSLVTADWAGGWGNRGNGDWDGEGNPWWGDGDDDDNDDNNGNDTAESTDGFGLGSLQDFNTANQVLIAHAVIASLVWV